MPSDEGGRVFRFEIGAIKCAIVGDGSFIYPEPGRLFFANAPEQGRDSALMESGIQPDAWHEYVSPYSALLIDAGSQRMLVDTGGGDLGESTGQLQDNLRREGIDFGGIDTVVFTHAHPDHIGGNLDAEGRPAFPRARWVLGRDEWQFWTQEPDLSGLSIPEPLKEALIDSAQRNLPQLEPGTELIDQDTELAPGVQAVLAPGHTPGHLVIDVVSEGQRLLWSGDAFLHPVHISHPQWYSAFDLNPEQAIATRQKVLGQAADHDVLVHAAHFPWPGLGHIHRVDGAFRWEPIAPPQEP